MTITIAVEAAPAAPAALDPRALRRCFGRFTTGVTVVTYRVGDEVRGATVNSFTSVSLDPPLVLVSLARTTQAATAMAGRPFAINVLRADQMDIALQFAGRPRPGLRIAWDTPPNHTTADGTAPSDTQPDTHADYTETDYAPSLAGAVAVFQCRPWQRYDGGDHVLALGEVRAADLRAGEPLVFSDGRFMTPGLPMLDGPLVLSFDRPPAPGWVGAAHRFHTRADG